MATPKTGRKGSRVTQKKNHEVRRAKGLTVDDFDLHKNVNGRQVDPTEGRETRLPAVIRGMRENRSIREIAFELNVHPATIGNDKKFVLEEAWQLRQDLIGLWLEEQLQQYEYFLGLLRKELLVELQEKKMGKDGQVVWESKLKDGQLVMVVNIGIMDKMLGIMDKVNELKGLKQAPVLLGLNVPGDNATVNLINQDADSAVELLDFLKSGKMGRGKTSLVS